MIPRYIESKDVRPGDTIVWRTNHPTHKLVWMVVKDVEEGEDNFRGYGRNGRPTFSGEEYNCYVLTGKVMCKSGVRTDHYDYPKYKITCATQVLLVDRQGE